MFGLNTLLVGNLSGSYLSFMFDLYDLLSPRVYVVSDDQYKKMLQSKRESKLNYLKQERERYEQRLKRLGEEIAEMSQ